MVYQNEEVLSFRYQRNKLLFTKCGFAFSRWVYAFRKGSQGIISQNKKKERYVYVRWSRTVSRGHLCGLFSPIDYLVVSIVCLVPPRIKETKCQCKWHKQQPITKLLVFILLLNHFWHFITSFWRSEAFHELWKGIFMRWNFH